MVARRDRPRDRPRIGPRHQPQLGAGKNSSAGHRRPVAVRRGRDPRRVVGKIRRAPARATGYRIIDWRPRRDRPPPAWVAAAEPYVDDPLTDAGIPFSQRCSLLDLSECNCRWPVGEPGNAAFFYCGAEPVAGKPYCAAHCARAYRPPDEVVPRRPSARQRRCWAKNSGFWIRFSGETAAERKWGGEDQ